MNEHDRHSAKDRWNKEYRQQRVNRDPNRPRPPEPFPEVSQCPRSDGDSAKTTDSQTSVWLELLAMILGLLLFSALAFLYWLHPAYLSWLIVAVISLAAPLMLWEVCRDESPSTRLAGLLFLQRVYKAIALAPPLLIPITFYYEYFIWERHIAYRPPAVVLGLLLLFVYAIAVGVALEFGKRISSLVHRKWVLLVMNALGVFTTGSVLLFHSVVVGSCMSSAISPQWRVFVQSIPRGRFCLNSQLSQLSINSVCSGTLRLHWQTTENATGETTIHEFSQGTFPKHVANQRFRTRLAVSGRVPDDMFADENTVVSVTGELEGTVLQFSETKAETEVQAWGPGGGRVLISTERVHFTARAPSLTFSPLSNTCLRRFGIWKESCAVYTILWWLGVSLAAGAGTSMALAAESKRDGSIRVLPEGQRAGRSKY